MSNFFDTSKPQYKSNRVEWLKLTPGKHITRLIGEPRRVDTHYIGSQRATVECLGDSCPICQTNFKIMAENPDNFRNVSGFFARSPRFFSNVLDRTMARICPSCGTANKRGPSGQYPSVCTGCEALVPNEAQPQPANQIKVMGISYTNAETLNTYGSSVLDENGNPRSLRDFDIEWIVTKANNRTTINPVPADNYDVVEYDESKLFDLTNAVVKLSAEEIGELLRGVSIKDIFLARRDSTDSDLPEDVNVSDDVKRTVEETVASLFGG